MLSKALPIAGKWKLAWHCAISTESASLMRGTSRTGPTPLHAQRACHSRFSRKTAPFWPVLVLPKAAARPGGHPSLSSDGRLIADRAGGGRSYARLRVRQWRKGRQAWQGATTKACAVGEDIREVVPAADHAHRACHSRFSWATARPRQSLCHRSKARLPTRMVGARCLRVATGTF
jgi:hypothetical protein